MSKSDSTDQIKINLRATLETRDLIDRAANLEGLTRTDFILGASATRAGRVIADVEAALEKYRAGR